MIKNNFKGNSICVFSNLSNMDRLELFDYFEYNDIFHIMKNNNNVKYCYIEFNDDKIKIGNDLYYYMNDNDMFICRNINKYDEIMKVYYIFDKCDDCFENNYLIRYYYNKRWICNKCIYRYKDY